MGIQSAGLNIMADGIFPVIGRTPLVRLGNIPNKNDVRASILVKLEYVNPTGSLKDRIYHEIITKAIENGNLKPGMEILEASTGNAGIACAFVGTTLGFKVTIVMPDGMSQERQKIMKAYGAEVITTPGGESDVDLCLRKIEELKTVAPQKYWEPGQFSNPDNIAAHFKTTGPEIWEQSRGKVDCFLASQGTGGTLTGVGRFLRQKTLELHFTRSNHRRRQSWLIDDGGYTGSRASAMALFQEIWISVTLME
jgi:cysteine synthase A